MNVISEESLSFGLLVFQGYVFTSFSWVSTSTYKAQLNSLQNWDLLSLT